MKKEIEQKPKTDTDSTKKPSRPFNAKKNGYKEEVYNAEEEAAYNKSDEAKNDEKNTAGPES